MVEKFENLVQIDPIVIYWVLEPRMPLRAPSKLLDKNEIWLIDKMFKNKLNAIKYMTFDIHFEKAVQGQSFKS